HLGTGNYNEEAALHYADLSYFTANRAVGDDVADLFNLLTGYTRSPQWQKLVVAPGEMRPRIVQEIEKTEACARKGGRAKIIFKSNALIDTETCKALCRASQANVETVLLIRGACTLRLGLPGISDRIQVRMVVDRFLEHARILYFQREDEERVFVTSTDIMHRNFDWRVEVMLPVEDPAIKRRLIDEILAVELKDTAKSAHLTADGRYERTVPEGVSFRAQAHFMALARERAHAEVSEPVVDIVDSIQQRA
ncbi:MAG: RNA degradosome polyphosphate kinase, partial [Myxococcota bacterium]